MSDKLFSFSSEYTQQSTQTLDKAFESCLFYRNWQGHDPGAARPIDERFSALPALTKKDIRDNFPFGFVPQGRDLNAALAREEIEYVSTSGTTEEKVTNVWNERWWDLSERASWRLNKHLSAAATGEHREAILTSAKSVGFLSDESDLEFNARRFSRFLYLNEKSGPHLWHKQHYQRMADDLAAFKPEILEANPSYLSRLCFWALKNNVRMFQPKAVVFTYELPLAGQLDLVKKCFDSPCVSSFGSTETGYVFIECEYGRLHQNSDFCRVDFEPFDQKHGGPSLGRGLVTTFHNEWYQLVRFDTGDVLRLAQERCPCGREEGYLLQVVEGRFPYCTSAVNGRLVTPAELDRVLFKSVNLWSYQLLQLNEKKYLLRLPLSRSEDVVARLTVALKFLYGKNAKIGLEFNADIVPGPSGKYIYSQSRLPLEIKDFLARQ
jgi:phenylacetate-CoA ligase